ncbi:MAG: hypothetical protein QNJ46_06530 [Leptolyngbyaceae cyanobacterium MO_188.B28]|nr:hypothetical protein [Leptolyngbyaceae cyanobacterium MO_188.B28]
MDIDPKTYPSRVFARFTAHTQLTADATGQPITTAVQRLGGDTYSQQVIPDGESPAISTDSGSFAGGFTRGLSANPTSAEDTTHGGNESQDSKSPMDPPSLESGNESPTCGIDEALFEEIVQTLFNPNRCPELYHSCGTQKAAKEVEARVSADIVAAYRQIKRKQACPIVQRLNTLL